MPRAGLTRQKVMEKAAQLANEKGLAYVTITTLADYLGIRKPSLYYHVESLEEVFEELMIYGWKHVSEEIILELAGLEPHNALREFGWKFYRYAIGNPGVFEAMLWYNRYGKEEMAEATEGLYCFWFDQTDRLGITRQIANHLLRTYRAFLEGFILLEINHSFGNPISIEESFAVSLEILIRGMEQYENTGNENGETLHQKI